MVRGLSGGLSGTDHDFLSRHRGKSWSVPSVVLGSHPRFALGSHGKYEARITVKGVIIRLGKHAMPEQAARAYDAAAKEHFGEFAKTNEQMGLLGGKQ
jgi:hypothetical protein